jgi:hypothetical protein
VRSSEEYIFFIPNALTTYCSLALTNTNTPHFIFYGVFYHAVLSMGMWVIHKLNDSIEECKAGDSSQYESIDKAAAFWIGSVSADIMACANLLSN